MRNKVQFAILFLNVANHKDINENLGRHVGDFLIRKIAGVLQKIVRKTDVVARYSDGDFAILLTNFKDLNKVEMIQQRISKYFEKPVKVNSQTMLVDAKIGIAVYPEDGITDKELLAKAQVQKDTE